VFVNVISLTEDRKGWTEGDLKTRHRQGNLYCEKRGDQKELTATGGEHVVCLCKCRTPLSRKECNRHLRGLEKKDLSSERA